MADSVLRQRLERASRVRVLAVGKAAPAMLDAFARCTPCAWDSALVATPSIEPPSLPPRTTWVQASHPIPCRESHRAGLEALARARALRADDLLVVLLSGGASALMSVPATGIALEDKALTQGILLRQGADIHELNAVRKHLSAIKGGHLAASSLAHVLTLAISDVVGDELSTIGSGPTVPDPTTFADASTVLEKYGGATQFPLPVVTRLDQGTRGGHPETPKAFDSTRVYARVVLSGRDALDAAAASAAALGYRVHRVAEPLTGEARDAGRRLLGEVREAALAGGPGCVLARGETTVAVTGGGVGGRNQELALSMAEELAELGTAAAASIGTDGVDGPTDAAGAIVDSTTLTRLRARRLEPSLLLADNDSYRAFAALEDLVRTGPTGTNVGDVQIVLFNEGAGR